MADLRLSNDQCSLPNEWIATASVAQLVQKCTDQKTTPPDRLEFYQVIHVELSDRVKENPKAAAQLAQEIFKLLTVDNSIRIQQLVQLVDFCSKNGNVLFLKALSAKPFVNGFLNMLKISRGKMNAVKLKLLNRPVRMRRDQSEQQLLSLVQMWADTFMMKEDQFQGFMTIYRQLRKEGVTFPPRDSNLRMLMENVCADSPMFDFVEEAAGKEVRMSLAATESAKAQPPSANQAAIQRADKVAMFAAQFEGDFGEIEFDDLNEGVGSTRELMRMQLTVQDSAMVKQSLEILDDMRMGAEDVFQLRSELATEIYETCSYIQKKSQKIVEAKLNAMDNFVSNEGSSAVDVEGYLNMIDLINSKLNAFKQQYAELKERAITEFKDNLTLEEQQEQAQSEQQDSAQPKKEKKRPRKEVSSSSSSSSDEEPSEEEEKKDAPRKEKKKKPVKAATVQVEGEEEEKVEQLALEEPVVEKKPKGLAKPPGGLRKLRAPPTSNLHNLRSIREKLQNRGAEEAQQQPAGAQPQQSSQPETAQATSEQEPQPAAEAQKVTYDLIDL